MTALERLREIRAARRELAAFAETFASTRKDGETWETNGYHFERRGGKTRRVSGKKSASPAPVPVPTPAPAPAGGDDDEYEYSVNPDYGKDPARDVLRTMVGAGLGGAVGGPVGAVVGGGVGLASSKVAAVRAQRRARKMLAALPPGSAAPAPKSMPSRWRARVRRAAMEWWPKIASIPTMVPGLLGTAGLGVLGTLGGTPAAIMLGSIGAGGLLNKTMDRGAKKAKQVRLAMAKSPAERRRAQQRNKDAYFSELRNLTTEFIEAFAEYESFAWKQGKRGGKYWLPDGKQDMPANRLYGPKAEKAANAGKAQAAKPGGGKGGPRPGEAERIARAKFEVARDAVAAASQPGANVPADRLAWLKARAEKAHAELAAIAPMMATPVPSVGAQSGGVVSRVREAVASSRNGRYPVPFPHQNFAHGPTSPGRKEKVFPGVPQELVTRYDDPSERIPVSSLVAIQKSLVPDHLVTAAERVHAEGMAPIVVIRQGGTNYIYDGHHRATVAKIAGESVLPARVYEYDPSKREYVLSGPPGATAARSAASSQTRRNAVVASKPRGTTGVAARPANPAGVTAARSTAMGGKEWAKLPGASKSRAVSDAVKAEATANRGLVHVAELVDRVVAANPGVTPQDVRNWLVTMWRNDELLLQYNSETWLDPRTDETIDGPYGKLGFVQMTPEQHEKLTGATVAKSAGVTTAGSATIKRKKKAADEPVAGYGQAGALHPVGVGTVSDKRRKLGEMVWQYYKGGERDQMGLVTAGPPVGLDMEKFSKDLTAEVKSYDEVNGVALAQVYDSMGRKYNLSKYDFLRAVAAAAKMGVAEHSPLHVTSWHQTVMEVPDPELIAVVGPMVGGFIKSHS